MPNEDDNVIHVVFGPEGHRVSAPTVESPRAAPEPASAPKDRDDPLADLYSRDEVARLFEIPRGRLRYWAESRFLVPSAKRGRRRFYTFQDLISIRVAKGLLERGIPLREVRKSVDAIRQALPKVVRPLAELRVVAEGHAMLVRDATGTFEPQTGQLVLDFTVGGLRDDVVRVLREDPSPAEQRTAYELYLEGCRLDEDESTWDRAEEAYLKALALDPSLANALTNLGNLQFRRGDIEAAEGLYRKALAVDPQQPEALYNLGFLHSDREEFETAVDYFERAIAIDPDFADAHFHRAMALELQGRRREARRCWQRYLEPEPKGEWSDVAREHLQRR